MTNVEYILHLEGEELKLSNQRALFWPREKTLIISDIHIGKTGHFRKHGIPVPSNVQQQDLSRLSFLLDHYKAEQLIIVGDLFHAEINTDMKPFAKWREQHSTLKIVLIRGNHDRLKSTVYDSFDIICCEKDLVLHPFKFIHEPNNDTEVFSISGHIHPGFMLKLKGRPKLKLPCFQKGESQLILPAFSKFTGLNTNNHLGNQTNYAFTEDAFYEF